MTESAGSPLRHVIEGPFTKRAWSEVGYTLASLPLAIAAVAFIAAFLGNGILWGLSAAGVRKFGTASRSLARGLLGEDGLSGLAERVRTVDGRIEINSPSGGPTTVTVELPSHA